MPYTLTPTRCFAVTGKNDEALHAATQPDLDQLLTRLARDNRHQVLTVTRHTVPCAAEITCDGCGNQVDDIEGSRVHVPADELTDALAAWGWQDLDGRLLCVDCMAQAHAAAAPTAGQAPLPGLPSPHQPARSTAATHRLVVDHPKRSCR